MDPETQKLMTGLVGRPVTHVTQMTVREVTQVCESLCVLTFRFANVVLTFDAYDRGEIDASTAMQEIRVAMASLAK